MTIIEQPSRVDGIKHPAWCCEGYCDAGGYGGSGHCSMPELVTLSRDVERLDDGYLQARYIGFYVQEQHGSGAPTIDLSIRGRDGEEAAVMTPAEAREIAALLLRLASEAEALA